MCVYSVYVSLILSLTDNVVLWPSIRDKFKKLSFCLRIDVAAQVRKMLQHTYSKTSIFIVDILTANSLNLTWFVCCMFRKKNKRIFAPFMFLMKKKTLNWHNEDVLKMELAKCYLRNTHSIYIRPDLELFYGINWCVTFTQNNFKIKSCMPCEDNLVSLLENHKRAKEYMSYKQSNVKYWNKTFIVMLQIQFTLNF